MSISGAVTGNASATELITIRESGSVVGDVTAPLVAVREGADLRGRVDTAPVALAAEMPLLRIAV
jgi:cytoskeletal protein CcmA (bactofilin family)